MEARPGQSHFPRPDSWTFIRDPPTMGPLGPGFLEVTGMSLNQGGFLDTLGSFIPGYRGYKDRETRRDTDRLLREAIVNRLGDRRTALDRCIADFSRQMKLDAMEPLELARRRLQKVTDQIRYAPGGYSGFFDTLQVAPEDLDRLYRHDLGLRDQVERLAELLGALPAAKDPAGTAEALLTALQQLEETVRGRDQALSEIK